MWIVNDWMSATIIKISLCFVLEKNNLILYAKTRTQRWSCFGTFSLLLPLGSVLLYRQAVVWRVTTHPSLHSRFHLQPTFLPLPDITPERQAHPPRRVSAVIKGHNLAQSSYFLLCLCHSGYGAPSVQQFPIWLKSQQIYFTWIAIPPNKGLIDWFI